jgi:hypothetical protein
VPFRSVQFTRVSIIEASEGRVHSLGSSRVFAIILPVKFILLLGEKSTFFAVWIFIKFDIF